MRRSFGRCRKRDKGKEGTAKRKARSCTPPPIHQQSEQPGEDASLATTSTGLDDDQATNPATESPIDFQNTVQAGDQSTEPLEDIRNTIELSTGERTHSRHSTAINQQDTVQLTSETPRSNKRQANTSASRRTKHQRQAIAMGPLIKNTILFNEVYGDGRANRRCRTMERNGCYYIFKCKKYNKLFDAKDSI